MGMYDYIKVDYPLPLDDVFNFKKCFQTKSFDNGLEQYYIDKNGTLVQIDKMGHPDYRMQVFDEYDYLNIDDTIEIHTAWQLPNDNLIYIKYELEIKNGCIEDTKLVELILNKKDILNGNS